VVGGGITGLTAARCLHLAGFKVTVFEEKPRVGGAINTIAQEGWLIEGGPNSLQETPGVKALLADLGIEDQRLVANTAAKKRFILRRGKLVPLPSSPPGLLMSPLFSPGGRLRVLKDLFARPRVRATDTSLADFIGSHFGRAAVDYALDPFVGGIYAGDPGKLSARYSFPRLWQLEQSHGSLLRGLQAEARRRRIAGKSTGAPAIISFAHGLQTLPDALAAALPPSAVRTGAAVTNVIPGRPWKVIASIGNAVETDEFDAVVFALPAGGLARVGFGTLGERPLASLEHQPQPPVSSLFLGFRREQVAHPLDGFGALIPSRERRNFLGVLFSSTLFPGRAPEGHVGLTVFAGGTRQPEIGRLPTEALLAKLLPDLGEILGITGKPVFLRHTFRPKAIPQYNLGHEHFLDLISRSETENPGLFVGGNVRDGISLPDCIKSGGRLANQAAAYLAENRAD